MSNSYRDLRVWEQSVDFSVRLYRMTNSFPTSEMYGLTSQMRRAAVSIPSNIAEGHERSRAEYANFLRIARGSLAELETQTEIAARLGYLNAEQYGQLTALLTSIGKQLTVLHRRIRNQDPVN